MPRSNGFSAGLGFLLVFGLVGTVGLAGCGGKGGERLQGYIEAEYVYVAPVVAGRLETLAVRRGQEVKAGELLYELEREPEFSSEKEAGGRLLQARSRLEDLLKGQRPTELAAIEARLRQEQAALKLARSELERRKKMTPSAVSKEAIEQAESAVSQGEERVREALAQLETARLGGREDVVAAAQAEVAALEANLEQLKWRLAQKTVAAPIGGLIYDTYYNRGELIQAGNAVVSILPVEKIKVRFYISNEERAKVRLGGEIRVSATEKGEERLGHINYVSPQAEYTPPVIYSREMRAKLVFMVEASLDRQDYSVLPGQPVDVMLSF